MKGPTIMNIENFLNPLDLDIPDRKYNYDNDALIENYPIDTDSNRICGIKWGGNGIKMVHKQI